MGRDGGGTPPPAVAAATETPATPSPTEMPTLTPTPSPTVTPTATPTITPTPTPTPTPQPTPDGVYREVVVPILTYHYIEEVPPGAELLRRDLTVSPERLEAQLQYLSEQGYTSISLRDLVYHLQLGWELPAKPLILTFDDGYATTYENAVPLLKQYGFTGTFTVITGFVDLGYEAYMTWPQIQELAEMGMEIIAHSRTHDDLRNKSYDYLVWQILGPKETLEANLGEPARFFVYPSGRYNADVVAVLRSAGYWAALTSHQGALQTSEALMVMPRIRARGTYDLGTFVSRLNFWLNQAELAAGS